jgi:hypothetical protein
MAVENLQLGKFKNVLFYKLVDSASIKGSTFCLDNTKYVSDGNFVGYC